MIHGAITRNPVSGFCPIHALSADSGPGGVFVFDVLGPGQVPPGARARGFRVGEDWAVLAERDRPHDGALRQVDDGQRAPWRASHAVIADDCPTTIVRHRDFVRPVPRRDGRDGPDELR